MNRTIKSTLVLFCTPLIWCQTTVTNSDTVPIYRVTVVERTVDAINYQYRSGPTKVDFKGTVLLSQGKGEATVESKTGRTEIDAKFDHLTPPTQYGHEYLTYVLWAVTPEGHPVNLGEVIADGDNHAKLHVTTELQVFGLIVTAEPYASVRQPSDVVVLENQVRPDTVGQAVEIRAKYGLMPRGHYTYNVPASLNMATSGPKLPMDQYQSVLHVYQAQNAVQIAHAMGAENYAPDVYDKARTLLRQARQMQATKVDPKLVSTKARQSAQMAEDARILAERRKHELELARAREETARAEQARLQAEAQVQRAQSEAAAARAQADTERAARERAERTAQPPEADRAMPVTQPLTTPAEPGPDKMQFRARMRADLNMAAATLDTPRGLVVTLADHDFSGPALRADTYQRLARIAAILAAQPGLRIEVEGHTDPSSADYSLARGDAVQTAMVRGGIAPAAISLRGFGKSRPVVSNETAGGRQQNRRVEIVISGDPIGQVAQWDRTYSLTPR
jgi:outer membrane protein OmpA-like peptidoglycan-associated protein